MTNLEPLLCRTISCQYRSVGINFFQNVANDVGYHLPNQGIDTVPATQKHNIEVRDTGATARVMVFFCLSNVVRPPSFCR
jgi:hypothetical protein